MMKPELLLPVGSVETFFAAMEGGADAFYLGMKKFNARNRAKNFSENDISNIIGEAHKNKRKVYITLNTLLKNNELPELVGYLNFLSQVNPDAVIVQDFATIMLIKKYFKNLKIHTSTQMSSHNALASQFFKKIGVERVILSRELSAVELKKTVAESVLPVEVFVHGALCYSFSGQCLFSSYLGGNSANRGMCAQVCRREFLSGSEKSALFSLKDFQLIDFVPLYAELGVASLKIEGRMKNAEYVYNSARAYRMAIDDHSKINDAKEILKYDFARQKTEWFMSKNISDAITDKQGTGIYIGKVISVDKRGILIPASTELKAGYQVRIRSLDDTETGLVRINKLSRENDNYLVNCDLKGISAGDEVYLSGTDLYKPKVSFSDPQRIAFRDISLKQSQAFLNQFPLKRNDGNSTQLYLRVSNVADLKTIEHDKFFAIFLKLKYYDLEKLKSQSIPAQLKQKLRIELPKFVSAGRVGWLRETLKDIYKAGYGSYVINHISQLEVLPANSRITTGESIYLLNDLSVSFIQQLGIKDYCYPLENDYPNMLRGRDRNGIIPIYTFPELFYSRMPVKSEKILSDDNKKKYRKSVFNGFTIITDTIPVSLTHNIDKFKAKGFKRFLIDFSHEKDMSKLSMVVKAVSESVKILGTSDFNMKKELH